MKSIIFASALLVGCVGYDSSQLHLRSALNAQQDGFNRCYENALARDAQTEGSMKMLVRVPARNNGQIDSVQFHNESQVSNPYMHRCIEKLLLGLPIGTNPVQDDLVVEYTVLLQPES